VHRTFQVPHSFVKVREGMFGQGDGCTAALAVYDLLKYVDASVGDWSTSEPYSRQVTYTAPIRGGDSPVTNTQTIQLHQANQLVVEFRNKIHKATKSKDWSVQLTVELQAEPANDPTSGQCVISISGRTDFSSKPWGIGGLIESSVNAGITSYAENVQKVLSSDSFSLPLSTTVPGTTLNASSSSVASSSVVSSSVASSSVVSSNSSLKKNLNCIKTHTKTKKSNFKRNKVESTTNEWMASTFETSSNLDLAIVCDYVDVVNYNVAFIIQIIYCARSG